MAQRKKIMLLGMAGMIAGVPWMIPNLTLGGIPVEFAIGLGFFIGIMSGGLGMGGVWLMVPLMMLIFRIDIKIAIGTALASQVLITLVGSFEHFKKKSVGLKLATPLIVGGFVGTPLGVWINVGASSATLAWIYSFLLFFIAVKMGYEVFSKKGIASETNGRDLSREWLGREIDEVDEISHELPYLKKIIEEAERDIPSHIEQNYNGREYEVDTLSLLIAGVFFGMINSLLGTSTPLMLPFLDIFMRLSTHVATAVSLINVTAISVPASLNHLVVGHIMYKLAGVVAMGGIAGALLGSEINTLLPDREIQIVMVFLLLFMSYFMLPVRPI